jgi:hypothetical protein
MRRDAWRGPLAVVLLAALGAAAAAGVSGSSVSLATLAGGRTTVPERPARIAPARVTAFAHVGAAGRFDLLLLSGIARGAQRATVVLVPTNTLVEVPALGTRTMADLPLAGPERAVRTTIENALGIRIDVLRTFDDSTLPALLAPAGTFEVVLANAVDVMDTAGRLLFAPGRQTVTPTEAARLLVAPEQPEIQHLVTVEAVFDGWLRALRGRPRLASAAGVARLARAEVRYDTLPVDRLAAGDTERYQIRRDGLAGLLRRSFAWALLGGTTQRPRIEILNGTGEVGVAQRVADKVVPAGGEVRLTGNYPGFGVRETRVVYYRDEGRPVAERMLKVIGVGGQPRKAEEPLDVVDVTIIVGSDFAGGTDGGGQ